MCLFQHIVVIMSLAHLKILYYAMIALVHDVGEIDQSFYLVATVLGTWKAHARQHL
jgi:hypothetical protein